MKYRVVEYETLSSTNDLVARLARQGAQEGLVIRSDFQTRGRGRGKHRWYSPRGKGLLVSILLRPRDGVNRASYLTVKACRAVKKTIERYIKNDSVALKLPNDVLVRGKKIAGVLVEGEARGKRQRWACIGIGVNVLTRKREIFRSGTSIYIESGDSSRISEILCLLLSNFSKI